jgi:hypothetical protein
LAYVTSGSAGLEILDLSDRTRPIRIAALSTGGAASSVQVVGTLACIGARDGGFKIVDVSSPSHPALLASYQTSGTAGNIAIQQNTAYVAEAEAGLEILGWASGSQAGPTTPSSGPSIQAVKSPQDTLDVTMSCAWGTSYVVETSTDLKHWIPLLTNQTALSIQVPRSGAGPRLYYRAVTK